MRHLRHQLAAVIFPPRRLVVAQIGLKRFLAPRHLHRVHNRRKRRRRGKAVTQTQRQHQRAVSAHGVTHNRLTLTDLEVVLNQGGQLAAQIVEHAEMRGPGLLSGIEIKSRTLTQIVALIVGNAFAARAGIRHNQHQTQFRRHALRARFGGEVLIVAGQPGQKPDHRWRRITVRLRQVDAEGHRAVQHGRLMTPALLPAAKNTVFFQ